MLKRNKMRLLILLLGPVALIAAQEPAAVAAGAEVTPIWLQAVLGVVSLVLTMVVVPYVRSLQKRAEADKEATTHDAKSLLISRAKGFLIEQALVIVERDFPAIIQKVASGEIPATAAGVKPVLYGLSSGLKKDAIEFFKREGIDLLAEFGDEYLDKLIRWAADKVSPFPGKETAVVLVSQGADAALSKGVEYVKGKLD